MRFRQWLEQLIPDTYWKAEISGKVSSDTVDKVAKLSKDGKCTRDGNNLKFFG